MPEISLLALAGLVSSIRAVLSSDGMDVFFPNTVIIWFVFNLRAHSQRHPCDQKRERHRILRSPVSQGLSSLGGEWCREPAGAFHPQ